MMGLERSVTNPSPSGFREVPEGRIYRALLKADYGDVEMYIYLAPIKGGWDFIAKIDETIQALNAPEEVDELQHYENLSILGQMIQEVQPEALVFPTTNGESWIGIPEMLQALVHVATCRSMSYAF